MAITSDIAIQYSDQDLFVPTEDLIDKYCPNLTKIYEERPEYKGGSTAPNGHSYGFPYVEEMYGLVLTPGPFLINKTWLDAVGKEVPTTVDEWVDCLRAFKEAGDLNGKVKRMKFRIHSAWVVTVCLILMIPSIISQVLLVLRIPYVLEILRQTI